MKILETINVNLADRSYAVTIGTGILRRARDLFDLNRRVIVVTDSGVPEEYSKIIAGQCLDARIVTFPEGEANKSLETFAKIAEQMLNFGLQRKDAVVAVGGGVVGDIAGFAAATYMRGIDFYNVPTTLLSSVDSSVGGKTAIDFCATKNIIGAFHQPRGVLIDTDTLKTLPERQIASGMAEIVKMALTSDAALFARIEAGVGEDDYAELICGALKIKKAVVEADERESGARRILNFGHTYGHGIESLGGYFHGECVALGMIPMCSPEVRARLIPVLSALGLPTVFEGSREDALKFARNDKKSDGDGVITVTVEKIGEAVIEKTAFSALEARVLSQK